MEQRSQIEVKPVNKSKVRNFIRVMVYLGVITLFEFAIAFTVPHDYKYMRIIVFVFFDPFEGLLHSSGVYAPGARKKIVKNVGVVSNVARRISFVHIDLSGKCDLQPPLLTMDHLTKTSVVPDLFFSVLK